MSVRSDEKGVNIMMFVVKTSQQLVEAIRGNAEEVMIVGRQASEILESINRPAEVEAMNPLQSVFSRLKNRFEVLELIDNSQQVEGILYRK